MKVDPGTYGAILLGAFVASSLSGVFWVQCIIYFRCFPRDSRTMKGFVLFVWMMELAHTGLVWSAMWTSFIDNFGAVHYVDHIPPTIALSVVLTAALTFLTHCLFAHRMYHLSEYKKYYLPSLVIFLALFRLTAASVSGGEMIHIRSYTLFREQFRWLFSLGLSLSSAVDILITLSLFFLLRKRRQQSIALHSIIDNLLLYAFEIGTLTSAATVASLICWIKLDNSLIFLGLHFVIGKLYANSLLATLNSRNTLRRAHSNMINMMQFNIPRIASDEFQAYANTFNSQSIATQQSIRRSLMLSSTWIQQANLKPEDSEEGFLPQTPTVIPHGNTSKIDSSE